MKAKCIPTNTAHVNNLTFHIQFSGFRVHFLKNIYLLVNMKMTLYWLFFSLNEMIRLQKMRILVITVKVKIPKMF